MRRGVAALTAAVLLLPAAQAAAEHGGVSYEGHYANAFVAGRAADGRDVAVMGGYHADFPYHARGSNYDQIAVLVEGERPIVVTGRPKLRGFSLRLAEGRSLLAYRGGRVGFRLTFESVEHPSRYEGDPLGIGDFFLSHGFETDRRPGLVYTPHALLRRIRGQVVLRSSGRVERLGLRRLHGQAEEGAIEAPTDQRFRSAYDYLAAPVLAGTAYTYVGFRTRALHSGADGAAGPYFGATASDEFTLAGRRLAEGNPRGVPDPFDNRGAPPPGSRVLARWRTDLGPGILHRALVRLRDSAGRPLIGLSETIVEDRAEGGGGGNEGGTIGY